MAIFLTCLDLTSRTIGSRLQYLVQHHASVLPVTSRVPPLLFLLYIRTISPTPSTTQRSRRLLMRHKYLQGDRRWGWCTRYGEWSCELPNLLCQANLLLNIDKCKTLRITRKRNKIDARFRSETHSLWFSERNLASILLLFLGIANAWPWRLDLLHHHMVQINNCKSSTSVPKPTNLSGIFDGPRSKSRPSLFVGLYILPSFVPTSHTRPKSGLHKLLTSLSVQNAFKDVRRIID